MEKDLRKQITEQEQKVSQQEAQKLKLKHEIQELLNEKEQMIETKDQEIRKLKEQIDEISSDFAQMLKNQLNKFQQRIDFGHQSYE